MNCGLDFPFRYRHLCAAFKISLSSRENKALFVNLEVGNQSTQTSVAHKWYEWKRVSYSEATSDKILSQKKGRRETCATLKVNSI